MAQTYNFQYNGLDISVKVGRGEHKITYPKGGNTFEAEFKGFAINYKGESIEVFWVERIVDADGVELNPKAKSYTNDDPLRYMGLYNAQAFGEPSGDFYARQCLNGIMQRLIGVEVFNAAGQFIEPVTE